MSSDKGKGDRYNGRGRPNHLKSRKNKRGGIKLAVLHLLLLEPMHGYQIIKELEKKSNGLYTPSAGTIYPALQELLERNLIDIEIEKDKKVYLINENGKEYIADFSPDESKSFWSEWRKRLGWKQSNEASRLKEELEMWEKELHAAKRKLIEDPQRTSELITLLSKARNQIRAWHKEQEEKK